MVLFVWFRFGYLACSCSGFFVCLFLKRNSRFVGLLLIELDTGLWVYLWFGLVSLDLIKIRSGCWIWIWGC